MPINLIKDRVFSPPAAKLPAISDRSHIKKPALSNSEIAAASHSPHQRNSKRKFIRVFIQADTLHYAAGCSYAVGQIGCYQRDTQQKGLAAGQQILREDQFGPFQGWNEISI
jgi:hypothetical protein